MAGSGRAARRGFMVGVAAGVWLGVWLARQGRGCCAVRLNRALDAVEVRFQSALARAQAWVGPPGGTGPPVAP